jgi:hypothetical protein
MSRDGKAFFGPFRCPWCQGAIVVEAFQCNVFRHGVFKSNGQHIPPHSKQHQVEAWKKKNEIHGCGNPVRYIPAQTRMVRTDWNS